ncbi:unnamed protein product [Thelazia callipaeda]|uniref:Amiloride-sensitive sodium channel n=1 Tax=Thelazia callipaeda TaxID=103827 RepID=A0A158RBI5_THECL|nr:unnamed protein product [Thelazia callipaeda]
MEHYLPSKGILSPSLCDISNHDKDAEIQCDLLTENEEMDIDPRRLPYNKRLKWHIKEFCYKTSIHGVPMLEQAPNTLYKYVWVALLIGCACMFLMQAISVVAKYKRNEKITNIELVFETGKTFAVGSDCLLEIFAEMMDKRDLISSHGHQKRQRRQKTTSYGIDSDMKRIKRILGFQHMSDEVAIITKARENIIFAMSELTTERRIQLSHNKRELIHKCSFNGAECNIDKDFRIVNDPLFGNCFTFNYNRTENKTNSRAGPMYGLRLLLYVNASDYLPTTEAVGVRITVHDKDEYPFPDTFGYSAPTGYISSFGMKMGCYHTCLQELIIRECGCADPRFPAPSGSTHCLVFDEAARKCIQSSTNLPINLQDRDRCRCAQPCTQFLYTVSYSASIWPSHSLNVPVGECNDSPEECIEQYQENGAMVEVFFDALNFEVFSESEAYGVVKMLSDFGGQLGLWSGVSFITLCEFVCLLIEILYMFVNHQINELNKKNRPYDIEDE